MFTRTSLGLESEHEFHDVDFVVYCEGGSVDGEGASEDEAFWSKVFNENGKRVVCKSMGKKSTVEALAAEIIAQNISGVLVAMDRDYDHIRGAMIDDPRVFYTYGYSWESDVFTSFRFDQILALFATASNTDSIKRDYDEFIRRQEVSLKRITAIDFKYIGHHAPLFDRERPMTIISAPASTAPKINIEKILASAKAMGKYQTAQLSKKSYNEICGLKDFHGKSVARLIFHWFVYRTKRIPSCRKAKFETFLAMLVAALDMRAPDVPRNTYYSNALQHV